MGTKNAPGEYDCHGKAFDDEPIFTLRAKDPVAATVVRIWAELRAMHFADGVLAGAEKYREEDRQREARGCALAMNQWRAANPGKRKN